LPVEPPAKRRRTNESTTPKRHSDETPRNAEQEVSLPAEVAQQLDSARITAQDHIKPAPTNHKEKTPTLISIAPKERAAKPTKKAPRARRKLRLNDEVEEQEAQQNSWEARTAGLEDTFIFGLKPKKRQPKPKTEEGAVADEPKSKNKKAVPRAKKTTKAKEQLEDKLEPDHIPEPAAQIEKPEKKPKTTRKKTAASESTATIAAEVTDANKAPIDDGADHEPDDSGEFFTAAEDLPKETIETESKPVKTKAAPKRALKRSIDEGATAAESINTATPEKPAKRPRRQAAISAIEKVAMGYENDLIPVDKLRRAPDVESKSRRSKKVDVLESSATALLSPPLTTQVDLVIKDVQECEEKELPSSPPLVVKRGRKPGVKATKARACTSDEQLEVVEPLSTKHLSPTREDIHPIEEEPTLPPKPPASRGRKQGVKAVKGRTDAADEKLGVTEPQPAEHLSPTKEDSHGLDDEQQLPPKPPAKRGRPPGSKNRKVIVATKDEESPVELVVTELAPNHLLLAKKNSHTPDEEPALSPDEEQALPPKLPAKRGRKPGVKNRKVTTIHVEPPVEPMATELAPKERSSTAKRPEQSVDTDSEPQFTRTPRSARKGSTRLLQEASENPRGTELSRPLAKQSSRESSQKNIEEQPTKQRPALADFDGNIIRKSLTVEGKKLVPPAVDSATPPRKQQSKHRKTTKESTMKSDARTDTIRAGQAQLLPQPECSLNEGPSHETTTTPRRRRVISAKEDLDWLFEKPKSRRPKPATVRQPAPKARQVAADQDMDLDDLLATVAALSGKLLTGRRGRVVAS
jgi:hypothetical protein